MRFFCFSTGQTIGFFPSCKKAAKPKNFKGDWILQFSYQTKPWGVGGGDKTFYNEPITITKNSWGKPINGIYEFSQEDGTGGHWSNDSKLIGKNTGTITANGVQYLIRYHGGKKPYIILIKAFPDDITGEYTTWQYKQKK